jgi:hypothetical protein
MKNLKILLLAAVLTGFCSCRKNLLDVQPANLLTQDQILSSRGTVNAYFASLYRDLPMEDFAFVEGIFNDFPANGDQYTGNWSDEYASSNNAKLKDGIYGDIYQAVRNVNTLISLIPTADKFDAATKDAFMGEARFIRAYYYWTLAKYYGGVPLILTPQATPVPVARNKEFEIYDQVKADLDFAASKMTDNKDDANYGYGRANKWAALALEARAMLHAGSIAKYGTVQLGGISGIDAAKATGYFTAAYDAAKAIKDGGKYSLYMKYAPGDREKNFQYLFYDTKQGDSNTEAILCRGYDFASTGRTHSNDLMMLPDYIRSGTGYAGKGQPTLDQIEKFENIDGTPGLFAGTGLPNVQYHFPTLTAPFLNKDPRLGGTYILNGTQFRNSPTTSPAGVQNPQTGITGQRGVIKGGVIYASSAKNQYFVTSNNTFTLNVTPIIGSGNSDNDKNPYWPKKWTDPVTDIVLIKDYTSRTSWMDLRYGEVLLDLAEAAFELNKPGTEALDNVNLIRARAGVPAYTTIDMTKIRHERMVEFPAENKIYWDYVRWRTLTTDFTNRQQYGLQVYWDIDTNDYVYIKVPANVRNYQAKAFYFQIPPGERTKNPLLVDNPGY